MNIKVLTLASSNVLLIFFIANYLNMSSYGRAIMYLPYMVSIFLSSFFLLSFFFFLA